MLIKSPCRDCIIKNLPQCIVGCKILDDIQTVMTKEQCGENISVSLDPRECFKVVHKSAGESGF